MNATVLLCDDEVTILRAAEIKLKRCGWNVLCASDGQQAWEIIQSTPPDILVTDCQMPRMSGLELVQHVRASGHASDLPIIMLSAKSYELDRQLLMGDWGVAMLLDKPFSPRKLADYVLETLEASRGEQPVAAV